MHAQAEIGKCRRGTQEHDGSMCYSGFQPLCGTKDGVCQFFRISISLLSFNLTPKEINLEALFCCLETRLC